MTDMLIGKKVTCVIGSRFLPSGRGAPLVLPDRTNGTVTHRDEYGNLVVKWPNGETYSYEDALLQPV